MDRTKKLLTLAALGMGATWIVRRALRAARSMDFRGKVVVITGGSRGLGLLLARRFAAEGASIAICSRDDEELKRAQEELSHVAQVHAERCDVSLESDVQRFIRNVIGRFGGIDVLVNNAGTIMVGPLESMTEADFDEAMQTHFYGPLYATLAALPSLRTRGEARIVNISSIGGLVPVPHLLPYITSKFALTGFSLGLAEELRKDNIYVTTVCPGLMRTGSSRNAYFKGQNRAEYAWFALGDSIPGPSQSADRAAARIVEACRHGDVKLITSFPAWAAAKAYALFPNVMTDVYAAINRMLPSLGGIGPTRLHGYESESPITRSALTALSRSAAERNNEVPAP